MTKTIAAVIESYDSPFTLQEIELAPLHEDELLVRIAAVGMCHTDLIVRAPHFAESMVPVVLGHEGAGVVEAIGAAVTGVAVGDHVVISFDSCGTCRNCTGGSPSYCEKFWPLNSLARRLDGTVSATTTDGAALQSRWFGQSSFAQHAIATARNVVVVDKDLPLDLLGPLGCSIQTGAGSVFNEMKLAAGQSIAIFGAGAVGLAAVMAAKIAGASEIVVVDLNQARLDLALELGATRVVPGGSPDVVAEVRGSGPGVDFSFDTTGVTSVMRAAVEVLRPPGLCILVGAANEFSVSPLTLAGRSVKFALEGGAVPQTLIPQLIDYWKSGSLPLEKLVKTYPMSDINQAEKDALSGATIKPILIP